MSIIEAIILGIVQGFTEFLPVSSSGHLVLLQKIFNVEEGALSFSIALHFATLIAVVVVYWKKILSMIRNPFSKLTVYIVIGTIPIAVIGLLFHDLIESFFETGATLGVGFIFTGLVLLYAESAGKKNRSIEDMKIKDPLIIGTAQAIAMLPAVSRSGMTVSGALLLGIERKAAADYAFLLSIPAILAAVAKDLYEVIKTGEIALAAIGFLPVALGMLFAAVSGFIAVKAMINLVQKGKLRYFSYYLWVIGALVLLDQLVFHIFF
jgi:undecaprenyl-diphosphatase